MYAILCRVNTGHAHESDLKQSLRISSIFTKSDGGTANHILGYYFNNFMHKNTNQIQK